MKTSKIQFAIFSFGLILVILELLFFMRILFKETVPGDNISDFIPPFLPLLNDFQVVVYYSLLGCNIRKSMSQLTYNIMCYLNNPEEFERNNQTFGDTWMENRKSCSELLKPDPKISSSRNLTRFAFVRDPEDRFVSFFVDKCLRNNVCWDCGDDIRCVVENIYDRLQKNVYNPNHPKTDYENWIDWHVAPQTWNCDFHQHFNDFNLIHVGPKYRTKAMKKLEKILELSGIPDVQIRKVLEEMEKEDTGHATYMSKDRRTVMMQIQKDRYIQNYLHKIYYHDYVAFGFRTSIP